jgi:transcriptional regulator GlxA family with amidase domain
VARKLISSARPVTQMPSVQWLRVNYAKLLRVLELACTAGMGVATLHHHFRILTAMRPLQYQKQLRLQAARGRMITEGRSGADTGYSNSVSY